MIELPLIKTDVLEEYLDGLDLDSFVYEWQKNQMRQISFTIYRTVFSAEIFDLLQNEIHLLYDGQEYVIKQCTPKSGGKIITKDIVASHVMYECQKKVWQYDTKGSEESPITLSVEDVMHWYFDENDAGFDFEVRGTFPTASLSRVGDGSGLDGINKCVGVDGWTINVWADNRHIILMDDANWMKLTSNQFRYLYNTDDVQASIDTTTVTNVTKCFPGQSQDDEGNNIGYVFPPFIHQNADSVNQWGKCYAPAVRDERFNSQSSMDAYAETQIHPDPDISLSLTYQGDQDVHEGDVWLFIHEPLNFDSDVTVVGIQKHPYTATKPTITFSNTLKDILQINREIAQQAKQAKTSAGSALTLANETAANQLTVEMVGEVNG